MCYWPPPPFAPFPPRAAELAAAAILVGALNVSVKTVHRVALCGVGGGGLGGGVGGPSEGRQCRRKRRPRGGGEGCGNAGGEGCGGEGGRGGGGEGGGCGGGGGVLGLAEAGRAEATARAAVGGLGGYGGDGVRGGEHAVAVNGGSGDVALPLPRINEWA